MRKAGSMKDAPKRIYLQIGPDVPDDTPYSELSTEDITWCEDRINDNDLVYVRSGVKQWKNQSK